MTAPARNVTLSAEQQAGRDLILSNDRHAFITGDAGTGKTTLTNAICDVIPAIKCATTGAAAINCGGVTVDSLFSIDRDTWQIRNPDTLYRKMSNCPKTIFIDEGAGCGARMADLLFRVARDMNKRLILVGDFAQTAPVKDTFAIHSRLFREAQVVRLRENHRQDNREFLQALNAVRVGEMTEQSRRFFTDLIAPQPDDDTWTRLYGTNARTDAYNQARLQALPGRSCVVTAAYYDLRDKDLQKRRPLFPDEANNRVRESRLADGLEVKINARVMLLRNAYSHPDDEDAEREPVYVNGDVGVLEGLLDQDGKPVEPQGVDISSEAFWSGAGSPPPPEPQVMLVRLDRTKEVVAVKRFEHHIKDPTVSHEPIGAVVGFPVSLGWATTCHKVQGQTLYRAYVDIPSILHHPQASRHGLAYVALSRARNPEGLRVSDWDDEAVYCSPEVRSFL